MRDFLRGDLRKPFQNEGMEQAIEKTRGRTFQQLEQQVRKLRDTTVCDVLKEASVAGKGS